MEKEKEKRKKELANILEHAGADTLRDIILENYSMICSVNIREGIKEDIIKKINNA